jgi:molybdopterin molybdotransferase
MRGFRARTRVDDALAVLARRVGALPAELVPVTEAAGRVAAADVRASVSVPHFARAAMDGYAVIAASTASAPVALRLVGEARPGRPFRGVVGPGEAASITTGAPVPEGADAVLMAELADAPEGGNVRVRAAIPAGKHVGCVGEDVLAGAIVLARGRRLRPQDAGLLASVGAARIEAVRRPRVRLLVTGDELLPPGSAPEGARIVDTNSVVLRALAARDGAASVEVGYVEDTREAVERALGAATEDVLLVSGGSSVGPEDHAPLVLAAIGELAVHGVAMRPAAPAGFGFLGPRRDVPVFLLPGNPVSCLCAYEVFAGPAIRALGGLPREWPHRRVTRALAEAVVSEAGRTDYVRVALEGDRARPLGAGGASILSSTTRADGVLLVPADRERLEAGEPVEIRLYD